MRLKVKIRPNSAKNEIIGWFGDHLKIRIAAPPQKGMANKELLKFLVQELEIKNDSVSIIKGFTSQSKLLEISGLSIEEFNKKLKIPHVQNLLI